MDNFHKSVIRANQEIIKKVQYLKDPLLKTPFKRGAGGDISYGIDRISEEIFIKHLSKYGKIVSEEIGEFGEGELKIVIDPIDGSSNLLSNFPYYGSSVALYNKEGKVIYGGVCNFATKEYFYKKEDSSVEIIDIFLLNQISYGHIQKGKIGIFEKAYKNYKVVYFLDQKGLKFRSPGAVALSLAYTQFALFFLYIGEVRIYDFAAGLFLVEGMDIRIGENYVIVSKDKALTSLIEEGIKEYI